VARYTVSLPDGSEETCGVASAYGVLEDGTLEITLDGREIARYLPGSWVAIHESAPSLVAQWPPPEIDDLLDNLHADLCSHGHCDPLGTSTDYASPAFNDMHALVEAVLSRIGISEHSLRSHGTLAGMVEARTRAVLDLKSNQR
jgi:hypothetical protein